jgi:hypothetical protein
MVLKAEKSLGRTCSVLLRWKENEQARRKPMYKNRALMT